VGVRLRERGERQAGRDRESWPYGPKQRGRVFLFLVSFFSKPFSNAFEFDLNFWIQPLIAINQIHRHECKINVAKPYNKFLI